MKVLLATVLALASGESFAADGATVPTVFEGDRIHVLVQADPPLRFYLGSGGGVRPIVHSDTARKHGMKAQSVREDGGERIHFGTLPPSLASIGIPLREEWAGDVPIIDPDGKAEAAQLRPMIGDGFSGATYFGRDVWEIDYPGRTLRRLSQALGTGHSIPMTFRVQGAGRPTNQARLRIGVAGEELPMLFDTGATSLYSEEARKLIPGERPFRASSFVRRSVFERWRKAHPEWRIVRGGDRFSNGQDLIEVPEVRLGSHAVGPVWFASRPDRVYDDYGQRITDGTTDGAVGGDVSHSFRLIADYDQGRLWLER